MPIRHGDEVKMNKIHHFDLAYNYAFKKNSGTPHSLRLLKLSENNAR